MNTLSVNYFACAVGGQLALVVVGIAHKQLVILNVCHSTAVFVPFLVALVAARLSPHHFMLFEVYEHSLVDVLHQHVWLVAVRECGIIEMAEHKRVGCASPLVYVLYADKQFLAICLFINYIATLDVEAHQFIAPPLKPLVLWRHVMIVGAAVVEVFESEEFVLCHCCHC